LIVLLTLHHCKFERLNAPYHDRILTILLELRLGDSFKESIRLGVVGIGRALGDKLLESIFGLRQQLAAFVLAGYVFCPLADARKVATRLGCSLVAYRVCSLRLEVLKH
jgi:hypothetical protein